MRYASSTFHITNSRVHTFRPSALPIPTSYPLQSVLRHSSYPPPGLLPPRLLSCNPFRSGLLRLIRTQLKTKYGQNYGHLRRHCSRPRYHPNIYSYSGGTDLALAWRPIRLGVAPAAPAALGIRRAAPGGIAWSQE
ncbi:hypothetical protein I7I53_01357 [Histoplasma capsulatum var. duboisii H88]|uniref:Uncharacterized protein n=1 Tax=Ajellomyces capsulatus (strain H88) TaxID=544711 RepID=A0A8A1LPL2_AJEC8|nr:hypothetical protein I7I53_01357 [Histoplasma capsulatum var. duboisii H88]